MPNIIDSAPASSPLELKEAGKAEYFKMQANPEVPTSVALPGSSNFDLTLFNVTATGSVKANMPGTLQLTLYGTPKPTGQGDIWLPLASSVPEPIGGAGELEETMWMVEGADLMVFLGSGKLQGTFRSNVASTPQPAIDLEEHPGDIEDSDPLYIFAIGASFTPTAARGAAKGAARAAADEGVICSLKLEHFTVNG
jgi:hypothetical protein